MNKFNVDVKVPIGKCPLTDLPLVAIFQSVQVHRNGYFQICYSEDTLDKNGDVFRPGSEVKSITHHPHPINTGEGVLESELTLDQLEFLTGLQESIAEVINGQLNTEIDSEDEEE